MRWRKLYTPTYTLLEFELEAGESVTAEAGAFLYGIGEFDVKTSTGGILSGVARALAGGESMFLNTYTARGPCRLGFAPDIPGDVEEVKVNGPWLLGDGAYLAHYGDIKVSIGQKGLRGVLAQGELFWLKVDGVGSVWVSSYGAIHKLEVPPGEKVVVDNAHFVAMPQDVDFEVKLFKGLKSSILGGEGLVVEVKGPAQIYIQTRNLGALALALRKFLRK